jgi:dolichol-phosphate mannosyltransferase
MTASAADSSPRPLLSIVSPVYRSRSLVSEFVRQVRVGATQLTEDFELLLVEDGSPDDSWSAILEECAKDQRVKGLQLSRNFGQQSGITAGLAHARGQYVVVMDSDLQDDPAYFADLYRTLCQGFDIVFARKRQRRFSLRRNVTTRAYYAIFRWLASVNYDPNIGAYSIISRRVVDAFLTFGDYRRGYVIVLDWLGFRRGYIEIEHRERPDGQSSYTLWKLLGHALTITLAYSHKPLLTSIYVGLALSVVSFGAAALAIYRYFTTSVGIMALGWTSLVVSQFFLSGLVLMSLGIMGLYVSRIFEQVKQRPIFVVRETRNLE